MVLTDSELETLKDQILANPEHVNGLDYDEVMALRKFMNPLGSIINTEKVYANLSLINWRDIYLRRLHVTALTGYIYRMLEEYEPTDELEKETKRHSLEEKTKENVENHEHRMKLIRSTCKGLILKFLNRQFKFDPDVHLRGSHKKMTDIKFNESVYSQSETEETAAISLYQHSLTMDDTFKTIEQMIKSDTLDRSDILTILERKRQSLQSVTKDLETTVLPIIKRNLVHTEVNTPVELYHNFDRYITNHYKQLKEFVESVYTEREDIEFGIILHKTFTSETAAKDYLHQHESEFTTDVITVENGGITLLGPFKENQDKVDYYNKNTEVLKRMAEQLEHDHRLGKDLMEKQIRKQKKKNNEETGANSVGLSDYAGVVGTIQNLSNKQRNPEEEALYISACKRADELKDAYSVPEDAIEVGVFYTDEGQLKKTKFYTQAEVPTAISRTGETKSLATLKR